MRVEVDEGEERDYEMTDEQQPADGNLRVAVRPMDQVVALAVGSDVAGW